MSDSPRQGGFDAGWLFVVAGVAICAAGLLIPAQRDLADIRQKRDALRHEEVVANERLTAHSAFLADIEREDPLLVRRLAAAQLNLMPKGDTPVLLASSGQSPVTTWIDATVTVPLVPLGARADSPLARLATGPYRLWLLSGGVLAVFLGLLLDPSIGKARMPTRAATASPQSEALQPLQLTQTDVIDADAPIVDIVEPAEILAVLPAEQADLIVGDTIDSNGIPAEIVDVQLDDEEPSDSNAALSFVEVDLPADAPMAPVYEADDPVRESLADDAMSDSGLDVRLAEDESELKVVGDASDESTDCPVEPTNCDEDTPTFLAPAATDAAVEYEPPDLAATAFADDQVPTIAHDGGTAPPDIETFDPFGQSSEAAATGEKPTNDLGAHERALDDDLPANVEDSASTSAPESAFPIELPFQPR